MILITHWDPDGIFCLYLFYKKFGADIKVYFSSPRKIEQTLLKAIKENDKSEEIYITDIAATQEAIYLSSYFKKAVWIDHHIWNNLEITSRVQIYIKQYKSCARVVAEYFNLEDGYLDFIDDIDSNNIKNCLERDFRDLIAAIRNAYPKSYSIWFIDIAKKLYNGTKVEKIIEDYLSILNRFRELLEKLKDKIILNTNVIRINNDEIFLVKADWNIPTFYIVDILKEKIKEDLDYVIVLYKNRAEIRTTTNKDVLKIARAFGGGGHKYAAGFQVNSEKELIEKLKELLK